MKLFLFLACWFLWANPAWAATLSLSPASINLETGQQTNLTVSLDPQGDSVIGTDILLQYDPRTLKVISVINLQSFPGNPATIIDNNQGSTRFSLINNYGVYQTAPASIATITVEGLQPASNSSLSFQFSPGATKDTNVVIPGGLDTLAMVTGTNIIIADHVGPAQPTITPTPAPVFPATTVLLPSTADPQAKQNLTKDRPANPPAYGLIKPVPPDFASPLPGPTSYPREKVLGSKSDLNLTPAKARHLIFWLLPLLIVIVISTYLFLSRRRHTANSRQSFLPADPAYLPTDRPSDMESTLTYYHP